MKAAAFLRIAEDCKNSATVRMNELFQQVII
jgi:hypothetical protein